jgi:hypothetical protein
MARISASRHGELTEVVWRRENNGSAEAVWYFQLGYESR